MREHHVTAYARAVVSGAILAGRLVRLAGARHLRDLDELPAKGYTFSEVRADHALNFFPEYLRLYDCGDKTGEPFTLGPAWVFIIGSLFGWLGPDGHRRFRRLYAEMGKGNTKTIVLAGCLLYGLTCDDEPGAEIYCAAVTREQAREPMFRDVRNLAMASPALVEELVIGEYNITHPATKSFIRPISSEGRSLDGKRVHMAGIDEVHEHRLSVVVDKLGLGTKGRRQPLILEITNSGYDRTSVCWQHHDLSRRILEGVEENETWFAYVCQLDVCESHLKDGRDTPQEGCADCDDWRDEQTWLKTNPMLDVAVPRAYLREQVREATQLPAKQNLVRRLNFCQWTESATRWVTAEAWALGGVRVDAEALKGRPCVAGLDLSSTNDLTALVLVFPDDDFFLEPAVPGEAEAQVSGGIDVLAWFWCPAEHIRERSAKDRVPYDLWRDRGFIEPTPGNTIDYRYIRRRIVELRTEGFNIREIGYDPAFAAQIALQLQDDEGFVVVPVTQGYNSINEPTLIVEKLIHGGGVRHGGHPVLAWNVGNAVVETDSGGRRRLSKGKSSEKIDGASALVTACKRIGVARGPARGSIASQAIIGPPRTTSGMYS